MHLSPSMSQIKYNTEDSSEQAAIYQPGVTPAELVRIYNNRKESYDKYVVDTRGNTGHIHAADTVKKYFSGKYDIELVDVGAGTGLMGRELWKRGYKNISAIEAAEGLLQARTDGFQYKTVYPVYIGPDSNQVPSDRFDCTAGSGVFVPNHIPVSGLSELIRITKPGGVFLTVMREPYIRSEFYINLEAYMGELEERGYWSQLERSVVENFLENVPGLIFAFRVNVHGFKEFSSSVL